MTERKSVVAGREDHAGVAEDRRAFLRKGALVAGLIQELFDVTYKLLGGLRGGLALATIISSTILAAMVGVIGAAEVAMGLLALPAMLKRGYDPQLACGSILAGGTLGILMIIPIVLGMFLDWVGILLLAVPIIMPILLQLEFTGLFGFDGPTAGIDDPDKKGEAMQLWFGVVYIVNMQMSFLSPPFGYALFYLKSVAPPEIGMGTIFRSAAPFLLLQALGLFICITFPQLILWLPAQVYGP